MCCGVGDAVRGVRQDGNLYTKYINGNRFRYTWVMRCVATGDAHEPEAYTHGYTGHVDALRVTHAGAGARGGNPHRIYVYQFYTI
jgi:hypothetical protein